MGGGRRRPPGRSTMLPLQGATTPIPLAHAWVAVDAPPQRRTDNGSTTPTATPSISAATRARNRCGPAVCRPGPQSGDLPLYPLLGNGDERRRLISSAAVARARFTILADQQTRPARSGSWPLRGVRVLLAHGVGVIVSQQNELFEVFGIGFSARDLIRARRRRHPGRPRRPGVREGTMLGGRLRTDGRTRLLCMAQFSRWRFDGQPNLETFIATAPRPARARLARRLRSERALASAPSRAGVGAAVPPLRPGHPDPSQRRGATWSACCPARPSPWMFGWTQYVEKTRFVGTPASTRPSPRLWSRSRSRC